MNGHPPCPSREKYVTLHEYKTELQSNSMDAYMATANKSLNQLIAEENLTSAIHRMENNIV